MKPENQTKKHPSRLLVAGIMAVSAFLYANPANAEDDPPLTSLIFNGADSRIVTEAVASDLGINARNQKTMEGWLKIRSFDHSADSAVFDIGPRGSNGRNFGLTARSNGQWRVHCWGNDLNFPMDASQDTLNTWAHLAVTYDGTNLRGFINGVEVAFRSQHAQRVLNTSDDQTFQMGAERDNHYRGEMRDVRVWSVARNAGQIQSTMHSPPLDTEGNNLEHLQAWWPMNEASGSDVQDMSGNGHHGTIIGAQWQSLRFVYEEVEADFTKDFGIGIGKVDELSLLRNRLEHWSLQDDALRMAPVTSPLVSTGALAPVTNREPGRAFTLESEIRLNSVPEVSANQVGLIALAGPHHPVTAPFDTGEDQNFYAFAFYPAATQSHLTSRFPGISSAVDQTAVIAISRGFNGPVLAAVPWDGRKPFPLPTLFADDFEDSATDSTWISGGTQNEWAIGVPSEGPAPATGTRVAGTSLNSAISPLSNDWLRSPIVDLSGVSVASLGFSEALSIDGSNNPETDKPYHNASVRVVDPDGVLIAELGTYSGSSNGWRSEKLSLPSEALDRSVRFEFHISTDDTVSAGHFGWLIDNVFVELPGSDMHGYSLKAEGVYNFLGELSLSFTVADLEEGSNHSQTITTTDVRPLSGNLFGIGGRIQDLPLASPEFDFLNLSMTLGDEVEIVASITDTARFDYLFGSNPIRVAPERFDLTDQDDWELQDAALRLATDGNSGNSLATTRIVEFKPGSPIQVESDFVLTSYNASVGGKVGLVLFAEEELTVLNPADSATYYTFQYDVGAAKIVFREGMDGTILYEAAFAPEPTVGATYSLIFSGIYNQAGVLEFTARIDDHNGGQASLSGVIAESLGTRSRFGIGAAQGGGDVWDFLSFSGNTTGGEARYLVFNGVADVIETGLMVGDLGLAGNAPKTVEAWAYTEGFNGGGIFQLGRTGTNNQDFAFRTMAVTNSWRAQFWGNADITFTPTVQTHNAWTHMAMVYDGSKIRIYINGELESIADRNNLNTQSDLGMRIGAWGGDRFRGAIRDVRLWNVARTGTDVLENMHASPLGQDGLLAWWPLDEGAKDVAHDRSGNNRHGLIARPQWTPVARTIRIGDNDDIVNHHEFSAVSNNVVRTSATASDLGVGGNSPKTLEAWARTRMFNGGGIMHLGVRGTTGRDFSLRTRGPTEVDRYMAQFWGSPDVIFTVPGSSNHWTHFAITYDGSNLRIYANGQLVESRDGVELDTGDDPLAIGEWNNNFFNGSVRDVRIWNVARTADEIQEFMHSSPAGQSGLTGWWPLGEGLGNTARDESGGDRHGTIITPNWGGTFGLGTRSAKVVRNGAPVFLQWDSTYASSTSISEIGEVASSGFTGLVAPTNKSTIYTLDATDHYGSGSTLMAWVRSVPVNGFESLRYVKFEIPDGDALRNPGEDAIQLSQFLFYRNGSRVDAVAVTNPGGDNPGSGEANNLLGSDPDLKWVDFNKAHLDGSHLVFDFGTVVEIDAYQLGTANDAAGRDPHRWTLYGRSSLTDNWELIEEMDLKFPLPGERLALTAMIPLAGSGMSFSDWLDGIFTDPAERNNPEISGRLATPAGDGVANILKYAFGLDPRTPVGSSELTHSELEGDKLRLTYLERVDAADIAYQPEKSFDLDGWSGDGIQEVLPRERTDDGKFEWVTVEIDVNGKARAFLRVEILDVE